MHSGCEPGERREQAGSRFGEYAVQGPYERGLFALSGDGIHSGHLDIIQKAARHCKKLIVLIAFNLEKSGGLFSFNERIAMAERAVKLIGLTNVRVVGTKGLMVDAYLKHNCEVYFRGIRDEQDRAAEILQHERNLLIYPAARMVMLEADPKLRLVSSSSLKGFISVGVTPEGFAPTFVTAAIEERLCKQIRIGVVGQSASGKSAVIKALNGHNSMNYRVETLNFDELIRELYAEKSTGAQRVRIRLLELFGQEVLNDDLDDVNWTFLNTLLFDHADSVENQRIVSALTRPHIMRLYRAKLRAMRERNSRSSQRYVVFVEGALLVEMNMTHLVSHRIICVESDPNDMRMVRCRRIPTEILEGVMNTQLSVDEKRVEVERRIAEGDHGFFYRYLNRWNEVRPVVTKLAREIDRQLISWTRSDR